MINLTQPRPGPILMGGLLYGSLFGALDLYSLAIGIGPWWWPLAEVGIAAAFGAAGVWRLSTGASLRQTVLIVSVAHFAVRLGPILATTWNDPGMPPIARAMVLVCGIAVMAAWFAFSSLVVRFVLARSAGQGASG